MKAALAEPQPLVSPRIHALILFSPRLRRMLLPAGILTSPYEVLDCQATLVIHDPRGIKATFHRGQRIRFLQDGVAGIMDHFWGDGVAITSYHNEAGVLMESFRDEGRRHLVIGLGRRMGRGEELLFGVERTAMVCFVGKREWVETRVDHPTRRLSRRVVFPRERPCLRHDGAEVDLPITVHADGRTSVGFNIRKPLDCAAYTIYL
jgi:hypothetical protein